MADGTRKDIEDVKVGDEVLATDPETGKSSAKKVTALHRNRDTDMADVTLQSEDGDTATIHTTQRHPFWDAMHKKWVDAANLRPGDVTRTPHGKPALIRDVQVFSGLRYMYNLTVDSVHTYYVVAGVTPVLVHNENPGNGIDLSGANLWNGRFPLGGALDAGGPKNGILYRVQNGIISNYAVYDANGIILRRVDLIGDSHGGVPTPHVQEYIRHETPDGRIYPQQSKIATPAGPDDLPRGSC